MRVRDARSCRRIRGDLRRSGVPRQPQVLAALSGAVGGLARAWPRFGAAVAGLCHRAAIAAASFFTR